MTKQRLLSMLLVSAAMVCGSSAFAQKAALKTNLLNDVLTTPNIGLEVATAKKQTFNIVYGLNPWEYGDGRQAKHWVLMPEYRWWTCSKFNGHFIGVHALGGEFNAGNINVPVPGAFFGGDNIAKEIKRVDAPAVSNRYEGGFLGAGFTYGYQWILSKHWNLEAEAGVGVAHIWHQKFPCATCGTPEPKDGTNYVGLTKAGISLMYVF